MNFMSFATRSTPKARTTGRPKRPTLKAFAAALAVSAGLFAGTGNALAHDGPGDHDAAAALRAGIDMADAANHLWDALTPEQQKQASFDFKDEERLNWHFIPRPRKGLPWKEMTPAQRGARPRPARQRPEPARLRQGRDDHEPRAGAGGDREGQGASSARPGDVLLLDFRQAGSKDPKEPWGWRVEGHHLSLNFTVAGNRGVVGGPAFFGANPAEVREGPRKGLRVLGGRRRHGPGRSCKALTDEQRKKAIVNADAPRRSSRATPGRPSCWSRSEFRQPTCRPSRRSSSWPSSASTPHRLRDELADEDLARIEKAGFDKISFAWAGGTEVGQPHYYRIQGPTFLIEYDDTQNNANHIHTVWRDLQNDFGEDLLGLHYEQEPHK